MKSKLAAIAIALASVGSAAQYQTIPSDSRTPKQYGQWLQSTGRQKWIKRK